MCFGVFMIFVAMWVVYLFPYIARFRNTTKAVIKNCALIAIANFPRTILLFLLFTVTVIVFFFVPLGMIFAPGIYMWVANRILEQVFCKYMTPEDLKAEEERNSEYMPDTFSDEQEVDDSTESEEA